MPSNLPPMRARPFLLLLLLCGLPSACSAPIALTQGALPCPEMVKASGLLNRTPGAPLPAGDTAGEIAVFGVQEAGQLERANADKDGVTGILTTCQAWQEKAATLAKPRRWWQVFG